MSDSAFKSVPRERINPALRRWGRGLFAVVLTVVLGIVLLPTVLSKTGLLQTLLNSKLSAHQIHASIGRAQVGWLAPTSFRQVHIADARQRWEFSVAELGSELSLLQMFMAQGDLGTFVVDRPTVTVTLDESFAMPERRPDEGPPQPGTPRALQRFRIRVKDGTILVRQRDQPQPLEFAKQINLQADWHKSPDQRVLTIAPGRPLDHVQLTPEMCDTGLKYVAPIFADVAWTRGRVSLELDECRVPLDVPAAALVKGRVALHSVETGLKNPLAREIAGLVAGVTRRELPETVRVADNSVVEFQVQDAQVHHQGLEFGLPEIAPELVVRSEGMVGFDRSLDLRAQIPLPLQLLGGGPIAQSLGNQTLNLPIRGTLDNPQLRLEGDGQFASDVLSKLLDPIVSGDVTTEDVADALREFRQQWQQRREDRGPLFPRLRRRRGGN
jgi:hypothetical protein